MAKKNTNPKKYSLHTLADYVSDTKVIIGAIIVVVGTLVNLALNFINYRVNLANAPIVTRVAAIESRDINIEKTLVELKGSDTIINTKLDRLLLKLVPDTIINVQGNLNN